VVLFLFHSGRAGPRRLAVWRDVLRSDSLLWDGVKRCVVAESATIFTDSSGAGFGAAGGARDAVPSRGEPAHRVARAVRRPPRSRDLDAAGFGPR
jgi:hypothetical protein